MNLQELENKKQELINNVEGWLYTGEEAKAQQGLIIKLLKGTDCTDSDFKEALEDDLAKGDYIKEHFDGLLYSDNTLVISW